MKQNRERRMSEDNGDEARSTVTQFVPRSRPGVVPDAAGMGRLHKANTRADDRDDDPGPSAA